MERILISETPQHVGETVKLDGWVDVRRDHGKLIFIDLRDRSGKVQMVILPNHVEAHAVAQTLRSEWVVEVTGQVNTRPEKLINKEQPNGTIEIEVLTIDVLNEAETPQFDVTSDGKEIGEEHRLKYRYFQIARCMRDEDLRGDRQPEFTQLDYEMSFVTEEDVLRFTEKMFIEMVQKLFPEKCLTQAPFPRLTYKESIEKYASDKPDLRQDKNDPNELAFAWIVDFPMFEKTDDGTLQ